MPRDNAETIVGLMLELSRAIKQRTSCCMRASGPLNMLQLHALGFIAERNGVVMKDLARYLRISSPSATVFAARLSRLKFIRRRADPRDRKRVRIFLTPAGKAIWEKGMADFRSVLTEIFARVPAGDQSELVRILSSLISTLKTGESE